MGVFSKLFNNSNELFLGSWRIDKNDKLAFEQLGDVRMIFKKDGTLTYEIIEGDKSQFIFLNYVVKGSKIITDQPSHPKKEETEYIFKNPTTLILKFGGSNSLYTKEY